MQFIQGEALDRVLHDLRRLRHAPAATEAPGEGSVAQSLLTGRFAAPAAADPTGPTDQQPAAAAPTEPGGPRSSALSAGGSEAAYSRSVARLGLQVAEALAYAHRQGVLHRDIKPANLLLDLQGTVWITDFGLAKAEGADELTHTGDLVGTLRFMAPERFEGRSLPQSDVYSLGLTLYELLTLRPAFADGNKGRLIEKVLRETPAAPRAIDRRIPRDLETVVLKCLAKEPAERYPTAAALAEELRRFLADRPIKARRAPWYERGWRWCRRNPAVAILLGAVAALLVVVATVSTAAALLLNGALQEKDTALKEKGAALQEKEGAERKARLGQAEALVGQAHGIRISRRPGQRFEALAVLKKAADLGRELGHPPEWFHRLRNEAIAALALPDVHITQQFGRVPKGNNLAGLSDDFELYAQTTDKGDCTVRRVADDSVVVRLRELGESASAGFGPGQTLAVLGKSTHVFRLWDFSRGEPELLLREKGIYGWTFHPNGRSLALMQNDCRISVYAVATGKVLHEFETREARQEVRNSRQDLRFHPKEPLIATFSYFSRDVSVYDLDTGAVVASATSTWRLGNNGRGDWSRDGRTLLVPEAEAPRSRSMPLTRRRRRCGRCAPWTPRTRARRASPSTPPGIGSSPAGGPAPSISSMLFPANCY
jgi:hypothetical protein